MSLVKKIFDYFVWLLFFGLLLVGGIFYIADRTYPGDYLYPFKLKFESFELATSKILNKQVDFSIELVGKRSNEATKVLDSRYAKDGLDGLNTQVKLTAVSISQMPDPIEKKRAAEKYIVKLNEVSSVLSEKQKELVVAPTSSSTAPQVNVQQAQNIITKPTAQVSQNPTPTTSPLPEVSTVSQQIDNTQETIQQAIDKMTNLTTNNNITPMENENDQEERNNGKSNNEKGNQREKQNEQRDQ